MSGLWLCSVLIVLEFMSLMSCFKLTEQWSVEGNNVIHTVTLGDNEESHETALEQPKITKIDTSAKQGFAVSLENLARVFTAQKDRISKYLNSINETLEDARTEHVLTESTELDSQHNSQLIRRTAKRLVNKTLKDRTQTSIETESPKNISQDNPNLKRDSKANSSDIEELKKLLEYLNLDKTAPEQSAKILKFFNPERTKIISTTKSNVQAKPEFTFEAPEDDNSGLVRNKSETFSGENTASTELPEIISKEPKMQFQEDPTAEETEDSIIRTYFSNAPEIQFEDLKAEETESSTIRNYPSEAPKIQFQGDRKPIQRSSASASDEVSETKGYSELHNSASETNEKLDKRQRISKAPATLFLEELEASQTTETDGNLVAGSTVTTDKLLSERPNFHRTSEISVKKDYSKINNPLTIPEGSSTLTTEEIQIVSMASNTSIEDLGAKQVNVMFDYSELDNSTLITQAQETIPNSSSLTIDGVLDKNPNITRKSKSSIQEEPVAGQVNDSSKMNTSSTKFQEISTLTTDGLLGEIQNSRLSKTSFQETKSENSTSTIDGVLGGEQNFPRSPEDEMNIASTYLQESVLESSTLISDESSGEIQNFLKITKTSFPEDTQVIKLNVTAATEIQESIPENFTLTINNVLGEKLNVSKTTTVSFLENPAVGQLNVIYNYTGLTNSMSTSEVQETVQQSSPLTIEKENFPYTSETPVQEDLEVEQVYDTKNSLEILRSSIKENPEAIQDKMNNLTSSTQIQENSVSTADEVLRDIESSETAVEEYHKIETEHPTIEDLEDFTKRSSEPNGEAKILENNNIEHLIATNVEDKTTATNKLTPEDLLNTTLKSEQILEENAIEHIHQEDSTVATEIDSLNEEPTIDAFDLFLQSLTEYPREAFFRCLESCKTTNQYDPVCGDNFETYHNVYKLYCDQYCGVDVEVMRGGRC